MIDMSKMKAFIEVLVPGTQCNIKCHYCYLIQENRRKMQRGLFPYSIDTMAKALNPQRWGGALYISLCGEGETLFWKELPDFTLKLLEMGHYVNITTNGTVTVMFRRFYDLIPLHLRSHLNFSFSYHPLELKRVKRQDVFFKNVNEARSKGCSVLVQMNLSDEYIPILDEAKKECLKQVGAIPQLAATRRLLPGRKWELYTNKSKSEYERIGSSFGSPLFNFTMKNFMVKRKEFCYAGKYSFSLHLRDGKLRACYDTADYQNIFEDVESPIVLKPIGKHCPSPYCVNSTHFIALGVMPAYKSPSYAALRNRRCNDGSEWYTADFKNFVSQKLYDNNARLGLKERIFIDLLAIKRCLFNLAYSYYKKIVL